MVDGVTIKGRFMALPVSICPPPRSIPDIEAIFNGRSAEMTIADLISSGFHEGFICLMMAAAPATRGAEKLVPLLKLKPDKSNAVYSKKLNWNSPGKSFCVAA